MWLAADLLTQPFLKTSTHFVIMYVLANQLDIFAPPTGLEGGGRDFVTGACVLAMQTCGCRKSEATFSLVAFKVTFAQPLICLSCHAFVGSVNNIAAPW